MKRKLYKPQFKRDPWNFAGSMAGGLFGAIGNIIGASQSASASKYAANMAYRGAIAQNQAQIQIANQTNQMNRDAINQTNQINYRINQENNAVNQALARQQNEWNLAQWIREIQYNSPQAQVQRLRDAGLNVALALGNGNFSPAGQLQSAPLANQQALQLQAPVANVVPNIVNPAQTAAQIIQQGGLMKAQYISQIARSATDAMISMQELRKKAAETGAIEQLTPLQVKKLGAEFESISKNNEWINQKNGAELSRIYADTQRLIESVPLLKSQTSSENERKELIKNQSYAQQIQNDIQEHTKDVLKQMPTAQLNLLAAQAYKAWKEGSMTSFLDKYNREHNRSLPTNTLDVILSEFFSGADAPKNLQELGKKLNDWLKTESTPTSGTLSPGLGFLFGTIKKNIEFPFKLYNKANSWFK